MKQFSIYKPKTVEEALAALSSGEKAAAIYAGGTDLLIRLKNRLYTSPDVLVDIKGLEDLRFVRYDETGGLVIGSLVTLGELAEAKEAVHYPVIAQTISSISSPELRNQSTVGGNILQEVWCPYYRSDYRCWRNGGDICYAEVGDNTEYQSIMGAKKSFAAYPGDLAITLAALDAKVTVAGPDGRRQLTIEELIPGEVEAEGKIQSHVLRRNELLAEISIPPPGNDELYLFGKVRKREVWDFASASAAMRLSLDNKTIRRASVFFGGIATRPWRDRRLEDYLSGKELRYDLPDSAIQEVLVDARPLPHNGYKKDQAVGLLNSMLADAVSRVK